MPSSCPASTGKSVNWLSSPICKDISLRAGPKSAAYPQPSRPQGGAYRDRHGRGAGCGGRGSVRRCQGMAGRVDKARELTNGTRTDDAWPGEAFGGDGLLRTAKSCGSDAPMLASSLWRCANPQPGLDVP